MEEDGELPVLLQVEIKGGVSPFIVEKVSSGVSEISDRARSVKVI